ncbi:MAG: sporulation peptidase YabG [Clostridia bacterium]|nr:sporulation peptidase YabG [Clostridium sp.]
MEKIKKGDIVARKSYNKDILFNVKRIYKVNNEKMAILTGITKRVEADSKIEDLEIIEKEILNKRLSKIQDKIDTKINETVNKYKNKKIKVRDYNNIKEEMITGKILHLDGDKKYSQKAYIQYKKMGLNAVVKNISEYKQPTLVYKLLKIYTPDILVITGHDGIIKKAKDYNNIYNYRNSKYFIETVKEARRYDEANGNKLVIFAGACQSYYEALILAGANFASSPARILIDFIDPIIVAEKVAYTERYKYITIEDIERELRDGRRGIDGIGANGKMYIKK